MLHKQAKQAFALNFLYRNVHIHAGFLCFTANFTGKTLLYTCTTILWWRVWLPVLRSSRICCSRVPDRRFNRCLRSCGSPNLEPALTQLQNVAVFSAALVCLPPASWPSQDDCVPWRGAECFPLSRRGQGVSVFSALWVWLSCCTCYCGVTALVI